MDDLRDDPIAEEFANSAPVFRFEITCDMRANQFTVSDLTVPPWIALGMLEYAGVMFRRRDVENAMALAMQNRPRIATPGGIS